MDRSNYPYWIHGLRDPEDRRRHVRAEFDRWLSDGVVWRVSDEDLAIGLSGGEISDGRLWWYQSLVGVMQKARALTCTMIPTLRQGNALFTSLGLNSWVVEITGDSNSMHEYYKRLNEQGKLGSNVSEEITDVGSGLKIVRITVT